jgi:hypothetical protein
MDATAAAAAAKLGGQSKMQMPQGVPADPEASKVSESEYVIELKGTFEFDFGDAGAAGLSGYISYTHTSGAGQMTSFADRIKFGVKVGRCR